MPPQQKVSTAEVKGKFVCLEPCKMGSTNLNANLTCGTPTRGTTQRTHHAADRAPLPTTARARVCACSDELEKLLEYYKNRGDQWRTKSYTTAINALKRHPKKIASRQEAMQVHGVGKSIADKVRVTVPAASAWASRAV